MQYNNLIWQTAQNNQSTTYTADLSSEIKAEVTFDNQDKIPRFRIWASPTYEADLIKTMADFRTVNLKDYWTKVPFKHSSLPGKKMIFVCSLTSGRIYSGTNNIRPHGILIKQRVWLTGNQTYEAGFHIISNHQKMKLLQSIIQQYVDQGLCL